MTKKPFMHLLAALGFVALTISAYAAWYSVVGKASAEAAALQSEIEARGAAGTRAASARKILDELSVQESSVYGHLVSRADVVSFLETVEATGRQLGTKVEVISVSDASGAENQISLALRISGPFDAVVRTIGALEYQKYATTLTNLSLESQGASVGTWTAAVNLNVGTMPTEASARMP
jgi:hypothetical protein